MHTHITSYVSIVLPSAKFKLDVCSLETVVSQHFHSIKAYKSFWNSILTCDDCLQHLMRVMANENGRLRPVGQAPAHLL